MSGKKTRVIEVADQIVYPFKLNKNQFDLCNLVMKGLKKADAYYEIYNPDKTVNRSVACTRCGKVLKLKKCIAYMNAVHEEELAIIEENRDVILSVEDRMIFLSNIVKNKVCNEVVDKEGNILEVTPSIDTKIRAVSILNDMDINRKDNSNITGNDIVINVVRDTVKLTKKEGLVETEQTKSKKKG